mgnify:CR=1 FL=1|tara:strand:- start:407 stop:613 length:207 start_codon:yes stop_codon:yes gene_type:complete
MSSYEVKNNTFAFFVNENKTKEKQPDYTGQGVVFGEKVKVAGWKNVSKNGLNYLSCVVEKDEKNEEPI